MKVTTDDSDHFAQLAVTEVVCQSARLVAEMLTLGETHTASPNLGDVLMAELAQELQKIGVPNKVAADMMGVSLSTLHRLRERQGGWGESIITSIYRALADKPLDKSEILLALHQSSPELVASAIRHLVDIHAIQETNGKYEVVEDSEPETDTLLRGLRAILVLIISEGQPATLAELCKITGQSIDVVRTYTEGLTAQGWLVEGPDGKFRQGEMRDYRVGSGASLLVSWTELTRVIMVALTERLKRADQGRKEEPGLLSIRFHHSYFEKVNARFRTFQDDIVAMWVDA